MRAALSSRAWRRSIIAGEKHERRCFRPLPRALSSRGGLNKFSPPPAAVGERRGAGAYPFAPAPLDRTDVADFVLLARRLSVPTDDAIRQFIDRVVVENTLSAPITSDRSRIGSADIA